jgi:hypothetical protein
VAVDKTKLRLDIIHSFGADFEDLLEKARYEVARNEGAKVALKTAQAKVAEICAHVEKDQEEGILDKAELNAKIEAGDFEDDELMVLSPSEDIRARKVAAKAEKEGAAEEPSEDAAPTEEVAAEPEKPARKPRKKRSKSGKNTG